MRVNKKFVVFSLVAFSIMLIIGGFFLFKMNPQYMEQIIEFGSNNLNLNKFSSLIKEEPNNFKVYDIVNKEITIKDEVEDIAKIKLNTPLNNLVPRGVNVKVAEFTITSFKNYSNVFKEMEFYDLNNNKNISKEFIYRYKTIKTYQINVPSTYKEVCTDIMDNKTFEKIDDYCYDVPDKYVNESITKEVWNDIDVEKLIELDSGNITIGIFTIVGKGDKVEWIPTLFDTRITEWATWTESLSVGLLGSYNFDEGSGDIVTDLHGGVSNFSNISTGGIDWNTTESVSGNSVLLDGDGILGNDGTMLWNTSTPLTVSFWAYKIDEIANKQFISSFPLAGGAYDYHYVVQEQDMGAYRTTSAYISSIYHPTYNMIRKTPTTTGAMGIEQWYMVTLVYNGTLEYDETYIYINGTEISYDASAKLDTCQYFAITGLVLGGQDTYLKNFLIDDLNIWNRSLTASEVSDLYNDGNGLYFSEDKNNPVISNVKFWTINSSDNIFGDGSFFNTTYLEEIEKMKINFTLDDETGFGTDIKFYFTANGTSSCSLGNLQSTNCYNSSDNNWIEVINNTNTSTFDDVMTEGDYIDITYIETNSTSRIYTIIIDEHYNPNVFKHYEAKYNFSEVKWQTGTDQRITKDNELKIEINQDIFPLDADQYKLDFRVNYTINPPTQPLEAYACNSTYDVGNVETSINCMLITEKLPSELQDDGTKYRGIFTKQEIDELGDIKYIILETDENNPNKYYYIKTLNSTNASYVTNWNYTTDAGDTWINLNDGYETELNINWFYNSINKTEFLFKLFVNDSLNNNGNSSIYNLSWTIDPDQNYPPIIDIITPIVGEIINDTININWTTNEPNDDNYTTNISINNGTNITYLYLYLSDTISTVTWNTSIISNGLWNLTVDSCENDTVELYCHNATHQIRINNTIDTIPPLWTNLRNFTTIVDMIFSETINATDESGISSYFFNQTNFFSINSGTGLITNVTNLSRIEIHWINISVNDTRGNINSSVIFINITEQPISASNISLIYPYVENKVPYIILGERLIFT